ncbi:uncharacterized protein LOC114364573, partial [Ostrinia furnacalis]|uniref:uncharacterized protein LOC114364573 n=1 Tax=Ostrinia furnacalis TaxID=93504 RepID=UPI00103B8C24
MDGIELGIVSKRCSKLTAQCYKQHVDKLEEGITSNPKLFWTLIKSKRGGSSSYPANMSDGHTSTSDSSSICELFAIDAFSAVFDDGSSLGPAECIDPSFIAALKANALGLNAPLLYYDEVLASLESLDACKGAGPDNVPPLFLRVCALELAEPLLAIFNKSLSAGVFPSVWKMAK